MKNYRIDRGTNAHCSGCGTKNPSHFEGYTECCNEYVCHEVARQAGKVGELSCCGAHLCNDADGSLFGGD